ncbi:hypothetical protein [Streptomonospora nanhaiensis]|uniref:hypothetical protein n=1 Tax=Streptomonospora nanhaiensis TaxID=1323731 RepID=UPI001C38B536|nr:hypothetical protein [Streptomonospora nanhaiensis]MBV2362165.1 hypothetical protein [Streptomonospora nanhaiensis]
MAEEDGRQPTGADALKEAVEGLQSAAERWKKSRDTLAGLYETSDRLLGHVLNDTRRTPELVDALAKATGAARSHTFNIREPADALRLGQADPGVLKFVSEPGEALRTHRPKALTKTVRHATGVLDASRKAVDGHIRVIRGAESDIAGYENGRTGLESILRSGIPQVGAVGEASASIKGADKFPPAAPDARTDAERRAAGAPDAPRGRAERAPTRAAEAARAPARTGVPHATFTPGPAEPRAQLDRVLAPLNLSEWARRRTASTDELTRQWSSAVREWTTVRAEVERLIPEARRLRKSELANGTTKTGSAHIAELSKAIEAAGAHSEAADAVRLPPLHSPGFLRRYGGEHFFWAVETAIEQVRASTGRLREAAGVMRTEIADAEKAAAAKKAAEKEAAEEGAEQAGTAGPDRGPVASVLADGPAPSAAPKAGGRVSLRKTTPPARRPGAPRSAGRPAR